MTLYPEEKKSECLICGKYITYTFALCRKHFEVYGDKPEKWPQWLRFMWNYKQRQRRASDKKRQKEISIEFLEEEYYFD